MEVHPNKKAKTAANFLRRAIEFFPFKIEYILTIEKNSLLKTINKNMI
jgi:hypothetical protein